MPVTQQQLRGIADEASFLTFVRQLREDLRQNPQEWQNVSLEAFLEASESWARDSQFGSQQGLLDASPWAKFATFLYCGKIYE
ncbi:MAG: hypothetical protein U0Q12_22925 [Vicinamibacterales bacterium]